MIQSNVTYELFPEMKDILDFYPSNLALLNEKKVKFSRHVKVYDTYDSEEYDRKAVDMTPMSFSVKLEIMSLNVELFRSKNIC